MTTDIRWNPKPVIRWWEANRLLYNAVLLGTAILLFGPSLIVRIPSILLPTIFFGFIANACYSLGPLIELYCNAYGIAIGRWRKGLFGSGLLFSIFVVYLLAFLSFDPERL